MWLPAHSSSTRLSAPAGTAFGSVRIREEGGKGQHLGEGTKDVSENGSIILQYHPKKCYRIDIDILVGKVVIKHSVSID